jgi:hypothetical protein
VKDLHNLILRYISPSGENEIITFPVTQRTFKEYPERQAKAVAYVNNQTQFRVDQRGKALRDNLPSSQTPAAAVPKTTVKPIKKRKNKH